jgi:two-component system chemotaxis response regulator CheY
MSEYRILIVEDSPTMRQLMLFALKKLPGVELVEASDGVDALRQLPEHTFDLVITDINMPVMDGLKLLTMLKSNPTYKDVPVVIITTEGREEDMKQGMSLGAQAYIPKPIQTPHLVKTVKDILSIP